MTRIMRDSITATDIPRAGLQIVAGYGNGHYQWTVQDWAWFPVEIPRVRIDVIGTAPATCSVLDVETGDATPAHAPAWAKERAKAIPRAYCTIYCNQITRPQVKAEMDAAGLRVGMDYQWWIATLDGSATVTDMTGVVAVQYAGEAQTGGHYDQSIVYDDAWHASPAPAWMKNLIIQLQQIATAATSAARLVEQNL